jgi:CRP/FNR family transcriptional regulator
MHQHCPNLDPNKLRVACAQCGVRELCLPIGLNSEDIGRLDEIVEHRRHILRGTTLYRTGDPFTALYAVRVGSFKTTVLHVDGREQVTGFHLTGEILGLDGIHAERQACDAVALEDSEICELPFAHIEHLARDIPSLMTNLHRILSREIVQEQGLMLMLGNMSAEERIAAFLVNLGKRYAQRGFSEQRFNLRMTRAEIGNYLGLKIETVSRTLKRLQDESLITVNQKAIELKDIGRLQALLQRAD